MPYQIEGGISGQHLIEQIVTNLFFLCSKGEDNNEIKNRIGYLKSSLEQNWRKFESMNEEKELWSDEDINETLELFNIQQRKDMGREVRY